MLEKVRLRFSHAWIIFFEHRTRPPPAPSPPTKQLVSFSSFGYQIVILRFSYLEPL